jgi:hypothetical protein
MESLLKVQKSLSEHNLPDLVSEHVHAIHQRVSDWRSSEDSKLPEDVPGTFKRSNKCFDAAKDAHDSVFQIMMLRSSYTLIGSNVDLDSLIDELHELINEEIR